MVGVERMEYEVTVICPHCGKEFQTTVEIEPSDFMYDRD